VCGSEAASLSRPLSSGRRVSVGLPRPVATVAVRRHSSVACQSLLSSRCHEQRRQSSLGLSIRIRHIFFIDENGDNDIN